MCSSSSAEKSQQASQNLSQQQFEWQKEQVRKSEADAAARRAAMEQGLQDINRIYGEFDDDYYAGLKQNYAAYANPQIQRQQRQSDFDLRSSLANRGKLGSSTQARQQGDLATTFGGIYRDSALQGENYANAQRDAVNSAKSQSIAQMYASESRDAGLVNATGSVDALRGAPAFEPVSALLSQAARFAQTDYNNSLYNGQSFGVFSPYTNRAVGSNSGQVKTVN